MKDKQSDETEIALLSRDIKHLIEQFTEFKADIKKEIDSLKNTYVTKEEFAPIKNIVYGMAGCILLTVLGAVLVSVLK